VFVEVIREESQKKVMMNLFSTGKNDTQNLALATFKLKTVLMRGESQREKQWCDHCHEPYHARDAY